MLAAFLLNLCAFLMVTLLVVVPIACIVKALNWVADSLTEVVLHG